MHFSLFSLASALTLSSIITIGSADIAGLSPRDAVHEVDKRLLCIGDTINEVFTSVGMGNASSGAQTDIENFCRSFIFIPGVTSYIQTFTPTTTFFPATVIADSTTEVVFSPTSTVTITASETEYSLRRRNHVKKDEMHKREVPAVVTARAELPEKMVIKARQAASSSARTLDVAALGSALSSACSCKFLDPLTDYLTSTAPVVTRTIGATDYRTVTLNSTVPGGVTTVTQTINVTSTIRPTGTGFSSVTMPTQSGNHTLTGTGTVTGSFTRPTSSRSSSNSTRTYPTRSHGTGTSGFPKPTTNSTCLPCSTGYNNITTTITAVSTTTELSTITDTETIITYKNTVTKTEGNVTFTEPATTLTVTGANTTETITDPGTSITVTGAGSTITDAGVTTTITDAPETTVSVTITVTTTEARRGGRSRGSDH